MIRSRTTSTCPRTREVWNQFFAPRRALDLGYSGARTENVLWNLQNGELDGQTPKAAVLLIGTNDSDDANYPVVHTAEQIALGTRAIVELLRKKSPQTKILLLRIFPAPMCTGMETRSARHARQRFLTNQRASELVAKLADGKTVQYLDVNHVFLRLDGSIDPEMMPDLLHPSPKGAAAWARAMEPKLSELMGDTNRGFRAREEHRRGADAQAGKRQLRLVRPPCGRVEDQGPDQSGDCDDRRFDHALLVPVCLKPICRTVPRHGSSSSATAAS